jgi:hypothetical protein
MLHHIGEISGVIGVAVIHFLIRRGRGWSSPPQLGQRPPIASVQGAQKVHSYEQIRASPLSIASGVSHFSHLLRISSGMSIR